MCGPAVKSLAVNYAKIEALLVDGRDGEENLLHQVHECRQSHTIVHNASIAQLTAAVSIALEQASHGLKEAIQDPPAKYATQEQDETRGPWGHALLTRLELFIGANEDGRHFVNEMLIYDGPHVPHVNSDFRSE